LATIFPFALSPLCLNKKEENMKKLIWIVFVSLWSIAGFAQKTERMSLRHTMTAEEAKLKHLIGKGFMSTDPPPGEVRNIAEFEPMEGVLITYHQGFGIGFNLISSISQFTTVTTVVASEAIKNQVIADYQNNNVNLDNCNFLIKPNNSYWTRDYGPWYIAYGDDQIGITDFIYNRPRPDDDVIPQYLAEMLGIEWFGMDLIATGGNYMTDGTGISFSTDLISEENPTLTNDQIDQLMHDYLGINTYEKLNDPTGTYIKHIDCWAKLLDVDKYLVRSVPETHPHYDEIEAVVTYLQSLTSGYGTPYEIIRVYTPNDEPYTNSLIINDHVYVAVTGSEWDDEAIATYQNAMPGYTIEAITGSWLSTDALHCRTHGLADRQMMYIKHTPLHGVQLAQTEYTIDAELTAYSGAGVNDSEVMVYYQHNDGDWQALAMTHLTNKHYQATIPAGGYGTKIDYYIYAEDNNEKSGQHPYIGAADPHVFYVGEQLLPEIIVSTDSIFYTIAQDQTGSYELNIQNSGEANLHIDFMLDNAMYDTVSMVIPDSPIDWQSNTYTEDSWEDFSVDETGELGSVKLSFNWFADQYPEDGSIHLKSPAGTIVQLAAGLNTGQHTLISNGFAGEELNGEWRLWLEDSYGDGGLSMNTINIRFSRQINLPPDWSSIPMYAINIPSGGAYDLPINFNSANMEEGEYQATISLSTNDINNSYIEIPVHLSVDNSIGINNHIARGKLKCSNPFSDQLNIFYTADDHPHYILLDMSGRKILEGKLQMQNHFFSAKWAKGIYVLKVDGLNAMKLIRE
jgi:agmatine/peptidylarginine deiminase